MQEKVYRISGLDCPNCAAKLERKMNEFPDVENVILTYTTEQLRVKAQDPDAILPELQKIADHMEEGVVISPWRKAKKHSHKHEHCDCDDHNHEEEGHSHDHEHCHENHEHGEEGAHHNHGKGEHSETLHDVIKIVVGAGIFLLTAVLQHMNVFSETIALGGYIIAYVILGHEVILTAIKNIIKGQVFDENFLMSIATIGAFAVGQYPEAVGVMLFYQIGELFEEIAVDRSRKQIMSAVDMRPEVVNLVTEQDVTQVDAEDVAVGDVVQIRPGDRVPLDGIVLDGESRLDTSPVTGEPVPVAIRPGDEIMSGCVNESGVITLKVTKELSESMVTRILDSVENAAANKPKIDRFITRFARVYTPIVVIAAVLTAIIPSLITGNWYYWIYTALTFLVISCPCALVLSIPLAFFAGIGAGSKQGILFKGGASLEALSKIKAIVMDKTGTITKGDFSVQSIVTAKDTDANWLLQLAASCEYGSTHPIAQSIVKYANENQNNDTLKQPKSIQEIPGKGVVAQFEEGEVLCGNASLLKDHNIDLTIYEEAIKQESMVGSEVLLAHNGEYKGYILISDTIKSESEQAVKQMRQKGLFTVMLTGDAKEAANAVAQKIGIDRVFAKLLPDEKCERLQEIREEKGSVMFIGDGINDAPVLAGADVGAAMGSGADAAIEAADVVFMTSSLSAVPESFRISRKACRIAKQNVIFALAVKAAVMVLGLIGFANMWMAVIADSGVAMLCVCNSIRVLRMKRE